MNTNLSNNSVTLSGRVTGEPTFSHEVFGEKFYEASLAVKRLSGMEDVLPVSVSEHLMGDRFHDGAEMCVKGQFRSYNKVVGGTQQTYADCIRSRRMRLRRSGEPQCYGTVGLCMQTARIPYHPV